VRNDTEFLQNFPEHGATTREATLAYNNCGWLSVINDGLRELERDVSRGSIARAAIADRAATWHTATYQFFAINAAAYDVLILMRHKSPYGHNLYTNVFRNRAGERDSPVVARYHTRVAADRAVMVARDEARAALHGRSRGQGGHEVDDFMPGGGRGPGGGGGGSGGSHGGGGGGSGGGGRGGGRGGGGGGGGRGAPRRQSRQPYPPAPGGGATAASPRPNHQPGGGRGGGRGAGAPPSLQA